MRWQFHRIAVLADFVWGHGWEHHLVVLADIAPRTLARWRKTGVVTNGPVLAMLEAFARLRRAGERVPDAVNPRPV